MKGKRAVEWRLIDEMVPRSKFDQRVTEKALEFAAKSDRPADEPGIELERLERSEEEDEIPEGWEYPLAPEGSAAVAAQASLTDRVEGVMADPDSDDDDPPQTDA